MGSISRNCLPRPKSPNAGKRLIPTVIDQIAKSEPNFVFVEIPVSSTTYDAGYKPVTYRQFANAINGAAWWLEKELGKGQSHETLAYIGPNDLRYPILVLAAVKAGYKMLFTSPRNSLAAHRNLFVLTDCHTMITTDPHPPPVTGLLAANPMRVLVIPGLEELFTAEHSHYPYEKTFEEAQDDPFVVLHTSGSTGLPKPRVLTNGFNAAYEVLSRSPAPEPYESASAQFQGGRFFASMPFFHAAGIISMLIGGVFSRTVAILSLSGSPLSTHGVLEAIKYSKPDGAFLPPSMLEEISKNPHYLDQISNLRHIVYAGGSLPKAAGDAVARKTRLFSMIGSTECGSLPQYMVAPEDWGYVWPNPICGGEFRYHSADLYELVLVKNQELEDYQTCFKLFPDLREYHTSDLYSKHPTKDGIWMHRGRSDDIIVFLNGEKTNPTTMEEHIQSHPEVRSVLVLGEKRFQAALLIEPSQNEALLPDERAQFIERIWPVVQEANLECPKHAKILKSHVLFVNPENPMPRAGKGTVQRRATLDLYKKEVDALYTDADAMNNAGPVNLSIEIRFEKVESLKLSILEIVSSIIECVDLQEEDDFFSKGMDSLQVIQLVRILKVGLVDIGMNVKEMAPSTIYTNSSVSKLASAIMALKHQDQATNEMVEKARREAMVAMLEEYSTSLKGPSSKPSRSSESQVVLLTGSTGALGSYLLEALLSSPSVSKIYCLNRTTNAEEKQSQIYASRHMSTPKQDANRLVFLTADLSIDNFALPQSTYSELAATTTTIIHNAWQVDFNLSLASFASHIASVRNLLNLSLGSPSHPKIFFISSIASIMNYPHHHPTSLVPEQIITDFSVPAQMGYGESKHVAERLLDYAHQIYDVPVAVCRVGQIAGPIVTGKGVWNKREWLPSLVISSKYLGMLPDSLGGGESGNFVDWIPIDLLSTIITELALLSPSHTASSPPTSSTTVYHTTNPHPTTWSSLLPTLQSALSVSNPASTTAIPIVPFATWLSALQASATFSTSSSLQDVLNANPALKLLEFYSSLASSSHGRNPPPARLDTTNTEAISQRLRELEAVKPEWMEAWTKEWMQA